MIEQRKDESRIEYLARCLFEFMESNGTAAECTLDYDETTCDGYCLAQDIVDEVGVDLEAD